MKSNNLQYLSVEKEFNSFLRKATAFTKERDCRMLITIEACGKNDSMFVHIIFFRGAQQRKVNLPILRFKDLDSDELINNLYDGNFKEVSK